MEKPVKLFSSVCPSINVGPKTLVDCCYDADPEGNDGQIHTAIRKGTDIKVREETISRLYWQPTIEDEKSLMYFCDKFKKRLGFYSRGQLLINLRTTQS